MTPHESPGHPLAKALCPHSERLYALLRILFAVLFAIHGVQKLWAGLSGERNLDPQLWIGAVIEVSTGALMALGLFTRWAAFLASGTMAVAYIQFHWMFRFDANFLPSVNQGEPALMYCFWFLYVAAKGPGICSLDRRGGGEALPQ